MGAAELAMEVVLSCPGTLTELLDGGAAHCSQRNELRSSCICRTLAGEYWGIEFDICIVLFLIFLSLKLVSAETPDNRRRLRVLLFGIALTLVPLLTLYEIAGFLNTPEDQLQPGC
jgi:hypothetical protein